MARILKSGSDNFRIDLDGSVGAGGRNARDDVGTLQQSLRVLSTGTPNPVGGRFGGGFFDPPDGGSLGVDGFYGPQTQSYIDAYQAVRVRLPNPGTLGPMPAPNGIITSTRAPGPWSFVVVDSDLRGQNTTALDAILGDPSCPAFLKAFFRM